MVLAFLLSLAFIVYGSGLMLWTMLAFRESWARSDFLLAVTWPVTLLPLLLWFIGSDIVRLAVRWLRRRLARQ